VPERPEDLVELLPESEPFLTREAEPAPPDRGLVLVHDLAGDFDAAHAAALAGSHLLASLPHRVIARFDADRLVDYRGHRPRMTFEGDRYTAFSAPEINLYALEDDAGRPFLLLHGAADRLIPRVQSERLYTALVEAGVEAELGLYEDADHMWLGAPDAAQQALDRTVDVLRRRLGVRRTTTRTEEEEDR